MPLYDLRCPVCGHEFEDLVSSYDAVSGVACENCGQLGMELKPSLIASSLSICGDCSSSSSCSTSSFT